MKSKHTALLVLFLSITCYTYAVPSEGFFLPDGVNEITFRYKSINNLIVLPVRINDTDVVNLVLDTGCRNLVLFGKRFEKNLNTENQRQIQFSGLGKGKPVTGFITLGNDVSFDAITGKRIAIVVVPKRNVFMDIPDVDGVIGYELFLKFEVEIDFSRQYITFRPAKFSYPGGDFKLIPLRVEDSKPILSCTIVFSKNNSEECDLLIDTGSCLGLLFTTPPTNKFYKNMKTTLGKGINGDIEGKKSTAQQLVLGDFMLDDVPTGIVLSQTHHYASLGLDVLKDYTLLLNYYKAYAGFKAN